MFSEKKMSLALVLSFALISNVKAFYGIGGCPTQYPYVAYPFGGSGCVPNGNYYSQYFDDTTMTSLRLHATAS